MTIRPALPVLDYTLSSCPACGHESLELVPESHGTFHTLSLTVCCAKCRRAEPLGWVTQHSKYLFPWVLRRWGVAV